MGRREDIDVNPVPNLRNRPFFHFAFDKAQCSYNGAVADYDRSKIAVAIGKANAEMEECERASDGEIEQILLYIEGKKKKRILKKAKP